MDEAHKLAIGERIKSLRERSPHNQPAVAAKLGIGLRAYQKLEEVGTTRYERCEELATIFDVDPMWIWEGDEQPATPDLMAGLGKGQLDRIEAKLDEILSLLRDGEDRQDLGEAERAAAELDPQSGPGSRPGEAGMRGSADR